MTLTKEECEALYESLMLLGCDPEAVFNLQPHTWEEPITRAWAKVFTGAGTVPPLPPELVEKAMTR